MAKTKRPEQKVLYDVAGVFLILFFLKEMVKVWTPFWQEGIFYLNIGCICCLCVIGAIFAYLYMWMDSAARKLRELFYYYKLEGMNGYPKFLGKSRADYMWIYGKHIVKAEEKENALDGVLVSPFGVSDSVQKFYANNHEITKYRYTLPIGVTMKDFGSKLEAMVQHLERETIIIYEDGYVNIVVGDRTNRKFVQSI